ncbi:hypothetical protein DDM78_04530 [Vibrio cholerae]|nr:hypothetical protein [Vibrio cholerae]EGR2417458.1 hypothetical protein [Vibrio cholerae]EGR4490334.1 hypothetical protein [Vibrio cholerae]TXX75323.1 hypothetical protein FXE96_12250 [Vibrio cholerae]TYA63667.1 hypothetical protein FXE18_17300 [Vibrio cholerae]
MKVPFLINILNDKAQQYHCSKHQNSETQDDNLFHLFIDITYIPVTRPSEAGWGYFAPASRKCWYLLDQRKRKYPTLTSPRRGGN